MTKTDYLTISKIAKRASIEVFAKAGIEREFIDINMDLEAVHKACGLRLDDLLAADAGNFGHDIVGITRHLNRDTGELEDYFLPRYAISA